MTKLLDINIGWNAFRNGEPTCLHEGTLNEIKKAVERVILATNDLRRRK